MHAMVEAVPGMWGFVVIMRLWGFVLSCGGDRLIRKLCVVLRAVSFTAIRVVTEAGRAFDWIAGTGVVAFGWGQGLGIP